MNEEPEIDYNTAIVRNIKNNDLYAFLGGNTYRNLRTGVEGEIDPELAKKIFKINVESTLLLSRYPAIETLIKSLNLKIEKQ